jgi:hypothetical protein
LPSVDYELPCNPACGGPEQQLQITQPGFDPCFGDHWVGYGCPGDEGCGYENSYHTCPRCGGG